MMRQIVSFIEVTVESSVLPSVSGEITVVFYGITTAQSMYRSNEKQSLFPLRRIDTPHRRFSCVAQLLPRKKQSDENRGLPR